MADSEKKIETTLLIPEVEELDEWASHLDELARKEGMQFIDHGRKGAIRLAVRYALAHKDHLEGWLLKEWYFE